MKFQIMFSAAILVAVGIIRYFGTILLTLESTIGSWVSSYWNLSPEWFWFWSVVIYCCGTWFVSGLIARFENPEKPDISTAIAGPFLLPLFLVIMGGFLFFTTFFYLVTAGVSPPPWHKFFEDFWNPKKRGEIRESS